MTHKSKGTLGFSSLIPLAAAIFLCACGGGDIILECQSRQPPLEARPGASRSVLTGVPVPLDGSASFDPDRSPRTFAWSFVSIPTGSSAVLSDPASVRPSFIPDLEGNYVVNLLVGDGRCWSAPASLTLTAENRAPVADAGADRTVFVGSLVELQGQGSDENGDRLSFSWTLTHIPPGSTATLSGASTPTPSFTPDLEGNYEASLVVDDGRNVSPADTVIIQASPPPPVSCTGEGRSTCNYGQFCSGGWCAPLPEPTCPSYQNFTQRDSLGTTGPMIFAANLLRVTTNSSWCSSPSSKQLEVMLSVYSQTPFPTYKDELDFYYVQNSGSVGIGSWLVRRVPDHYVVSGTSRERADIIVNLCVLESSTTRLIGFYFSAGNFFCYEAHY